MALVDFSGLNSLGNVIDRSLRSYLVTTREEIDAYGFVLGPSVRSEMGLGNDNDA